MTETVEEAYYRCMNYSLDYNCTEEEWLRFTMGPRTLAMYKIVPITALLVFVFVTGCIGNVSVCVVIVKNSAMHTATNYYLFSLALSDLVLLLFGLPNDLSAIWHQYPYNLGIVFCKTRAFISEAASYVSVLTIVAFSLERYLAICHPLLLYTMSGLRRAKRIVMIIWVVALLCASPYAYYTTVNYQDYPPGSGNQSMESAFCGMLKMPPWYPCELSSVVFFIVPGLIILCLYTRIALRITRVLGPTDGSPATLNGVEGAVHGDARQAQSKKNIIRMLVTVVVTFYVCWAPFHIQRLFFIYGTKLRHYVVINEWLFYIAGIFYYVSATVNPIVYSIMSLKYRAALKDTLCCKAICVRWRTRREHSSMRDTTVNYIDGTPLVRIRSEVQDNRNSLEIRNRRSNV